MAKKDNRIAVAGERRHASTRIGSEGTGDLVEAGTSGELRAPLKVVGLFAGVGGLELGLRRAGHETSMFCEIEPGAQQVLRSRFPEVPLEPDICALKRFPSDVEFVVGGFPCQDLSQAGKTAGIEGSRSGLVGEVFRLVRRQRVPWLLLENVPFMLQLSRGRALDVIVDQLEALGYRWAYRVIDSRSFGLPQRRERVFLLASREHDPRDVLYSDDVGSPASTTWTGMNSFGFYWTEGVRGLGAAVDAVPTLKGGSTIGIPSPPAVVLPDGRIVTPDIRDAERMQGFNPGWTEPAELVTRRGHRWKLVGNAVTVDVAEWIGRRMRAPVEYRGPQGVEVVSGKSWPRAAYNVGGGRFAVEISSWPARRPTKPIHEFFQFPPALLSEKATNGFLARITKSSLRFPEGFREAVADHLRNMRRASASAA